MITTNILKRVFRVLHNKKTASAYTIEKGEKQYLVSASHVFEGSLEIPSITLYHDKKWKSLEVKTVFNSGEVGDTIIFELPHDISPRHAISLGCSGMYIGSWAYFLGFPFGMSTPSGAINNNFPIPFVKAGLVSSLNNEHEGLNVIFLDGHNNKGFSGGPAVWVNPNNPNNLSIIGTVSSYLTENPIHPETLEDLDTYLTNAGIVEVFWVRDILDRI